MSTAQENSELKYDLKKGHLSCRDCYGAVTNGRNGRLSVVGFRYRIGGTPAKKELRAGVTV